MEEPAESITVRPFIDYLESYNENTYSRGLESGLVTPEDVTLIREFIGIAQGEGLSPGRIRALVSKLVNVRRYMPPYSGITFPEFMQGVAALRDGHYAPSTKLESLRILKKFIRHLREFGHTEITEAQLKKVKIDTRYEFDLSPADVLTKEEVIRLVQACRNSRDRALIALTYESGARISEVCALQWKNLTIEEQGISIITQNHTKGEKRRYVRAVWCRPYVAEWLSNYPVQPVPDDAPVFVTQQLKSIRSGVYRHQFNRIVKRSGIEKPITLHSLRHARVTHLAADGYSETVIKLMIWGDVNTPMLRAYLHLSNQDIDREFAEKHGFVDPTTRHDPMKPRQCTQCYLTNKPDAMYCNRCAAPLTEEARGQQKQKASRILDRMDQDPRLALIDQKLEEFRRSLIADLDP
ncbi:MAG: tyrosine-type recombinase/integrase [Bacilli bacterium]|jgi:integrase